jgi:spermidine/putrescine transport system permease protein
MRGGFHYRDTFADGADQMTDISYIDRPNRPLGIYAIVYLAFLYIPVLFLPLFSFNDSIYIAFPMKGYTTQWYGQLFSNEPLLAALMNSVKVGAVSAVIATILGIFAAKAVTRYRIPGRGPVVSFIMLPLVVPGIIFGVALLILMSRLGIPLSLYTVTIGHVIVCVPFAMATLIPRFEGFDKSIEEASADLGENAWGTFWRVTLPIVFPGVVASLLLSFTISFDEFIMAFFLSGTDPTLPVFIWGQLRFPNKIPGVLALGSIVLLVSFIVVFFAQWLTTRGTEQKLVGGA